MAIFRTEKTKDYTVMSNLHLKDKRISLKAKGLLSQMLSLPEDWDYTMNGLCRLNKESLDAIRSAIRELESAGYIVRSRERDNHGRLRGAEYVIYEKPRERPKEQDPAPALEDPISEQPTLEPPTQENPTLVSPVQGNQMQLNTKIQNTNLSNTYSILPSLPAPEQGRGNEEKGRKESVSQAVIEQTRMFIRERIAYQVLVEDYGSAQALLDELVELMTEVLAVPRPDMHIAGYEYPYQMVRDRFLSLRMDHIQYVLDCMSHNTTRIRNAKQYLLAVLFNAPTTMEAHTMTQVQQDAM